MQSFSTLTAEWSSTMAIFNRMMKRSSAWAALYKAGGGQSHALMEADFGPGGPTNLSIEPFLNQKTEIKSFLKDPWFQELPLLKKNP